MEKNNQQIAFSIFCNLIFGILGCGSELHTVSFCSLFLIKKLSFGCVKGEFLNGATWIVRIQIADFKLV
ncbi:hypothetical protein H5410_063848 [Solanum commersonii]|uniref:Uncharacterized protein n=1 Tax=Solanum commersonii TaxID=4109 RepID=A0A9J5WEN7_SOLCO|nr:hypothetical protein H5410_063848 [Solanum commersonii]